MSSLKKRPNSAIIAVFTILFALVLLYLLFTDTSVFLNGKQSDLYTNNWSGYAATVPSSGASSSFNSISASWTVPKVASSPAPGYSSAWIGIGGLLDSGNNRLIQIGTEHDVQADGSKNYYAWFEVLPRPAVNLGSVSPQDSISARINRLDVAQSTWHITLSRESHGISTTLIDTDVAIRTDTASTRSAEFIIEAPAVVSRTTSKLLPLANFDTVAFSHCTTNLGELGSLKNVYRITMTSDGTKDGALLASTSAISKTSGDDDGGGEFSVKRIG
jgi:peptidase A4-like protein